MIHLLEEIQKMGIVPVVVLEDSKDAAPLYLYPKEFDLLYLIARHPNWVFSKEEIYENVYRDEIQIDNTIAKTPGTPLHFQFKREGLNTLVL